MIDRPQYLRALRRWKDKQMIKVITGIRRCGKSTLMELFQAELRLDGVPDSQIIAVNLEDFANIELRDPMKLHAYILSRAGNERAYVFLDEIQNVRDFPPMIDSLFLRKNLDLYLTGSNAYMLSGDLAPAGIMDADKSDFLFPATKRAALSNTLIVPAAVRAADLGLFHMDSQVFPDKINGLKNREIGISLTAPGPSDFPDRLQCAGCHFMGKAKVIFPQRRGTGNNRNKHSRTDPGAAGTPETACSSRHRTAPVAHLNQRLF